jgi:carbamoyl-phosphate synthase large subunit
VGGRTVKAHAPCIAVSGLHRGENPQPGAGIIRSLRRRFPDAFVVGLSYDVMESGIYAEDGPDEVHLMPYPAAGGAALLDRIDAIRKRTPFDLFIPTLDAEIEVFASLRRELAQRGIAVCLPSIDVLKRRAKQYLPALAALCGVRVPETCLASDVATACQAGSELGYPLVVKGPYYDAKIVHHAAQLSTAAGHLLSEWGHPVILQRLISGSEFNVLGLGDGDGGWLGHCCIRKTQLSDKGKGLSGITVADARLSSLCARLVRELKWPGPFEIELIREETTGDYVLIEINPRFPAWIDFPSMLGANFAAALIDLLQHGCPPGPVPDCPPGSFYIRHQIEVVGDLNRYAELLKGEPNALPSLLDEPASSKTKSFA